MSEIETQNVDVVIIEEDLLNEEPNEGDNILSELNGNSNNYAAIWFEFYNQQTDVDLAKYLITLLVIYGKYKALPESEKEGEEAKKLRRLPAELWKKGFKLPKTFEQIESVARSVARAISILYADSTDPSMYKQMETVIHLDIINDGDNPLSVKVTNTADKSVYTINVGEGISTSAKNIRAILVAFASAIKEEKFKGLFSIPDAVAQAKAFRTYRASYDRYR